MKLIIDAPPLEVKRSIVQQERQLYVNTRYQLEVRLRVLRRVDSNAEQEAALIKDLERVEKMIDAYDQELAGLVE